LVFFSFSHEQHGWNPHGLKLILPIQLTTGPRREQQYGPDAGIIALLDGSAEPQCRESPKRVSPDCDVIAVDKFPERSRSQHAVYHELHLIQSVQVLAAVAGTGGRYFIGVLQKFAWPLVSGLDIGHYLLHCLVAIFAL